MNANKKLLIIKIFHSFLWVIIVFFIGYIWYAGLFNKINNFLWISITIVISEGIILISNKGRCPITNLATYYVTKSEPGFDIFLPKWFAKYNIPFFSIIAILGIILVLFRIIS
jgi:hypothetical protein